MRLSVHELDHALCVPVFRVVPVVLTSYPRNASSSPFVTWFGLEPVEPPAESLCFGHFYNFGIGKADIAFWGEGVFTRVRVLT